MSAYEKMEQHAEVTAALLAVVATILDCEEHGVPAVAKAVCTALDSAGFAGFTILESMVDHGVITVCRGILGRGPQFHAAAQSVTKILGKGN